MENTLIMNVMELQYIMMNVIILIKKHKDFTRKIHTIVYL